MFGTEERAGLDFVVEFLGGAFDSVNIESFFEVEPEGVRDQRAKGIWIMNEGEGAFEGLAGFFVGGKRRREGSGGFGASAAFPDQESDGSGGGEGDEPKEKKFRSENFDRRFDGVNVRFR